MTKHRKGGTKRKAEDIEEGEIIEGEGAAKEDLYDEDLVERVCFSLTSSRPHLLSIPIPFFPYRPHFKLVHYSYKLYSVRAILTQSKMY